MSKTENEPKKIIKKVKASKKKDLKAEELLQKDILFLKEEGIEIPKKNQEISELAKTTREMPKYPFSIRIHGNEVQEALSLQPGKRYALKDLKAAITGTGAYFELADAEFKFDNKNNSIYPVLSSSKKG